VRNYGKVAESVQLVFALFLEITLFVILLSLYIRVEDLHALRRRPHARRISSFAERTFTYTF